MKLLSPTISARMWFDPRLRHNTFRWPRLRTFRLRYHVIVVSQWDGNPAFTVHAVCYIAHAFRAPMKLAVCCYEVRAKRGGGKRGDGPGHSMQGGIQRENL